MLRILLILILFCSTVSAQDLTPGSYRVEYGGLYKIAASQTHSFMESRWHDQEDENYLEGTISFTSSIRRHQFINDFLNDWEHGPPWWTRHWWDSLPPEKGGAPVKIILIQRGSTHQILQTPFFTLSSAFDFRWRSLQATVDMDSEDSIILGREKLRTGWHLKFSPEIKFSASAIFRDPVKVIRRIGFNIGGVFVRRGQPLIDVYIRAWVSYRGEAFASARLSLLQW